MTTLIVNRLLVNIAYMKIWVHLTFVHQCKNLVKSPAKLRLFSLHNDNESEFVRLSYVVIKSSASAEQCP